MVLTLMSANTLFWCLPLYLFALLRYAGPAAVKPWCTRRAMNIAELWIGCNNIILDFFQDLDIEVEGMQDLSMNNWYLVVCNHQTWADILILQRIFNRRIPMLKFFIKQQLIYTPVIGIAWWVLDFPIMKRYSREFIAKHPELKGKDLETTRRSCEKFKLTPVAILNFLEGTRFTQEKREKQHSPWHHLLKPKGGGAALVVSSLGERIDSVLNVTIYYPGGVPGFFEFLCGYSRTVKCVVEYLPVPLDMAGTDDNNSGRASFRHWIDGIWERKDRLLEELHEQDNPGN